MGILEFDMHEVIERAAELGLVTTSIGTGYVELKQQCCKDMVFIEHGVTVWQDGTLEGYRLQTVAGRERRVVEKGADMRVQGKSTDRTTFSARVSTSDQAMHVIKAITRVKDDGRSTRRDKAVSA